MELSDPSIAAWSTAQIAELALAVERAAVGADPRVAGVEQAIYAGGSEHVAIASSTGISGEYESSSCYAYTQAMAKGNGGMETGLGFGIARGPVALDPAAIGREAAERATAMVGATKPPSRSCPVLLDPTVAASFAGLIGKALGADAVQRGRSPFAERLGEGVADEALALHDDGLDPGGSESSPIDGEGVGRRRTALIEGGLLRSFLFDTYTARRGGAASTGERRPRGLPRPAPGLRLQPDRRHRHARLRAAPGRGGRGCLRHRRRRPALGRQPGFRGFLGRRLGPGDPRRGAGRAGARVHDRQRPRLDAACRARGRRGGALGPVRGLGQRPATADRRDDRCRCLSPCVGLRRARC